MTNQHPITPPLELLDKWNNLSLSNKEILVIAAQWGADQELAACCEWIKSELRGQLRPAHRIAIDLRDARRPEPPSLKEQALEELTEIGCHYIPPGATERIDIIRRALEALPE
jgi:hypothetical protein